MNNYHPLEIESMIENKKGVSVFFEIDWSDIDEGYMDYILDVAEFGIKTSFDLHKKHALKEVVVIKDKILEIYDTLFPDSENTETEKLQGMLTFAFMAFIVAKDD